MLFTDSNTVVLKFVENTLITRKLKLQTSQNFMKFDSDVKDFRVSTHDF